MDGSVLRDPVLRRFRAAVADVYAGRLERVVLFGSRARGDFRAGSDYDIAVFIRDPDSRWEELGRLADITTRILVDSGAEISAKPFRSDSFDGPTALMQEIRRDGIEF